MGGLAKNDVGGEMGGPVLKAGATHGGGGKGGVTS